MQITVWSVAADDDNGTYASVHETELAAYRRLIELTVDSDDKDQVAKAEAFIEAEDSRWAGRMDSRGSDRTPEYLQRGPAQAGRSGRFRSSPGRREQTHHAPRTRQRAPRLAPHAGTMGAANARLHFHRSPRPAGIERAQLLRPLLRRRGFSAQPRRDRRPLRKAQHGALQLTGSRDRARERRVPIHLHEPATRPKPVRMIPLRTGPRAA